jgi:site-specific recombinase XerD
MIETKGLSPTTVGIYLRNLKALFNIVLESKDLSKEFYPFSKNKYVIPNSKNIKKSLSKEQLSILFNSKPATIQQEKAKDFWFFSYACNGMNIKDIALLKFSDINNDTIHYFREKTKRTSKSNKSSIVVHLNDFTISIINKYRQTSSSSYIFDIIQEKQSLDVQRKKAQAFTRFINQHIKKLAIELGLPSDISTIWARHSFASNFIQSGGTIVDTMESLGHSSITTTQNYLKSFENNTKKELSKSLMDFN